MLVDGTSDCLGTNSLSNGESFEFDQVIFLVVGLENHFDPFPAESVEDVFLELFVVEHGAQFTVTHTTVKAVLDDVLSFVTHRVEVVSSPLDLSVVCHTLTFVLTDQDSSSAVSESGVHGATPAIFTVIRVVDRDINPVTLKRLPEAIVTFEVFCFDSRGSHSGDGSESNESERFEFFHG